MIIGLSGKRGVGKTTAAEYLVATHKFIKVSFADRLKEVAGTLFPFKSIDFSTGKKEKPYGKFEWSPREFMINLGQFMRYHDPDYWVKAAGLDKIKGRVVVDDVRFPNEAEFIHSLGGYIIRINRYEKLNVYGKNLDDISETALDDYKSFVYTINDCVNITKPDLYKQIDRAIVEISENIK